jgi:flagellar assembly factor FliW
MPEIVTRQFGKLEFDESAVLHFPAGLPGFESRTRFLLIERPGTAPLLFLQSLDAPKLCFVAAPMHSIDPDYALAMTPEDQQILSLSSDSLILAVLSASASGRWTANLLAPVVIDKKARRAVQAVRADARYSHRHPLPEPRACS